VGSSTLSWPTEEWNHRDAPTKAQTEVCIYYKMVELMFEGPQLVVTWAVLLTGAVIKTTREKIPGQDITDYF
jgi:hypothetical protein